MSIQVFGLPVSKGVAIGRAVLIASSRVDVAHYFVKEEAVAEEIERLRMARDTVINELSALEADLPGDAPPELASLLDVHQMLLQDDTLASATKVWIVERHYNAEWALSAQLEVLARQFDEMEDEYLRERKSDLEQVVERMLRALARKPELAFSIANAGRLRSPRVDGADSVDPDQDQLILVANDIAPAGMLQFKRSVFKGFVTDIGGKTSHTAIVARSMDIPAVVGAREASRIIRQDDWLIVDGDAGLVVVDPSDIVLEEYRFKQRHDQLDRGRLSRLRHTPAVTLDGERVELMANIEMPADASGAIDAGAMGVGLYRSEFLFMNRDGELPDEDEQFEAYRAVVESMGGMPVTIRTVDIGADKPLERMSVNDLRQEHALNPALGLRAIRWSLAEPSMFRQQLRAILRASVFGNVRLLIPMVAHLSEARMTLEAIERAKQQLRDAGRPYRDVPVGAMIEVPAAALMLPAFLKYFDFVSIGTNDLIQYTLAIDRADESVAHLYDPWHPAVLELIRKTVATSLEFGKDVSLCGEMAGDPEFTEVLLAFGLRSLSMHPSQIAAIKQQVLLVDTRRLSAAVQDVLSAEDPKQLYAPSALAAAVPA